MNIDAIRGKTWESIIAGSHTLKFDFLALQFFLSILRQRLAGEEISMSNAVIELKKFFVKHGKLPSAVKDLQKIAQLGGIHV